MCGDVTFSARAVRRLRLAAALLKLAIAQGEGCSVQCQRVLDHINRLSAERRQRLREQVDWVEAYELAEERASPGARMSTGPVHKAVDSRWSDPSWARARPTRGWVHG